MKGPIHYFLADGAGYGKFLSPRSLLALFGITLLLVKPDVLGINELKRLRPYLAVWLLLPFLLAANNTTEPRQAGTIPPIAAATGTFLTTAVITPMVAAMIMDTRTITRRDGRDFLSGGSAMSSV